ncbi:uncharacterized protein LOC144311230 isoform X2 [Canis aureus]
MPWHSENSVCYTITDLPDKAALIWEWLVEEELEDIPGTSFHRTNVSFVRILSVSLSCLPPITVAGRSWILNNSNFFKVPNMGDLSSLPREEKQIPRKEHFSSSNSHHIQDVSLALPMYFFNRAGKEAIL